MLACGCVGDDGENGEGQSGIHAQWTKSGDERTRRLGLRDQGRRMDHGQLALRNINKQTKDADEDGVD